MDVVAIGFLTLGAIGLLLYAASLFRRPAHPSQSHAGQASVARQSAHGDRQGFLAKVESEAVAVFRDTRTPGEMLDLLNEIGDYLVANTDCTAEERVLAVDAIAKHLTHKKPKQSE